jgi:hypothetical protein
MSLDDDKAFDAHFKIVVGGAERTRGILYFFLLVLIVSLMSTVNSYFETGARRLEILNAAVACLGDARQPGDSVPLPGFDKKQEKQGDCKYYYDYVENNYKIQIRIPKDMTSPTEPEKRSYVALDQKRASVLRLYDDGAFIAIPVVNFRLDVNFQTSLQSLMAAVVLSVLSFSLAAERKALTDIRPLVDGELKAKAILNSHVFLQTSTPNRAMWLFLFVPNLIALFAILSDAKDWEAVLRDLYPGVQGILFYTFEDVAFVICLVVAFICYRRAELLRISLSEIRNYGPPANLRLQK